jgi:hypothetical protein
MPKIDRIANSIDTTGYNKYININVAEGKSPSREDLAWNKRLYPSAVRRPPSSTLLEKLGVD